MRPVPPGWGSSRLPRTRAGGVRSWRGGRAGRGHAPGHPGRTPRSRPSWGGRWPGRPDLPAIRSPLAHRLPAMTAGRRGRSPLPWPSGASPTGGAPKAPPFDCSGLTWAAWRAAGVTIPRTAAGQLAGLPRARGPLRARRSADLPHRQADPAACGHGGRPRRWSRPAAAASRSAPPASAAATWAPSDRGPADDRRLPGLRRLGAADRR